MSSETEITGTSIDARPARRCGAGCRSRTSGTFGSGTRCTLARAMRLRVGRQDDGAVHLRQLRQPLRAELGVEQEAARADREHLGTVADDDQRAHLRLQDAVESLAERRARRHQTQGEDHGFRSRLGGHGGLSLGAGEGPRIPQASPGPVVRQTAGISPPGHASPIASRTRHLDHVEASNPRPRMPVGSPRGGTRGAPPRPGDARAAGPSAPRRPGRARRSRRCRG